VTRLRVIEGKRKIKPETVQSRYLKDRTKQKYPWSCQIKTAAEAISLLTGKKVGEDAILERLSKINMLKEYKNNFPRKYLGKTNFESNELAFKNLIDVVNTLSGGKVKKKVLKRPDSRMAVYNKIKRRLQKKEVVEIGLRRRMLAPSFMFKPQKDGSTNIRLLYMGKIIDMKFKNQEKAFNYLQEKFSSKLFYKVLTNFKQKLPSEMVIKDFDELKKILKLKEKGLAKVYGKVRKHYTFEGEKAIISKEIIPKERAMREAREDMEKYGLFLSTNPTTAHSFIVLGLRTNEKGKKFVKVLDHGAEKWGFKPTYEIPLESVANGISSFEVYKKVE